MKVHTDTCGVPAGAYATVDFSPTADAAAAFAAQRATSGLGFDKFVIAVTDVACRKYGLEGEAVDVGQAVGEGESISFLAHIAVDAAALAVAMSTSTGAGTGTGTGRGAEDAAATEAACTSALASLLDGVTARAATALLAMQPLAAAPAAAASAIAVALSLASSTVFDFARTSCCASA